MRPLSVSQNYGRSAAVVLGALLIVGIPLGRLGEGNSGRFGWQMYSVGVAASDFTIVTDTGESYEVDLADHLVVQRSDLPLAEVLPPHLCSIEPRAVTIITHTGESEERLSCSDE